jgi:hypothetical protein
LENRNDNCFLSSYILKANGQSELSALGKLSPVKGDNMSNNPNIEKLDDDMNKEYDFTHAVHGKYAERFPQDAVMVTLAPDVAAAFPDANSVNEALRLLLKTAKKVAQAA